MPAAFEALIRQHQRMIYSLTCRMTGSVADAEDLTQETFLRAWRQIGSYRAARSSPPGFIASPSTPV